MIAYIVIGATCAVLGFIAGWLVRDHNAKTAAAVNAAVAEVKKL